MVGFAMKHTFDYVKRGERLNAAKLVLKSVNDAIRVASASPDSNPLDIRLDTMVSGVMLLDIIADATGLSTGASENNNKTHRTLLLNGRSYLETTTLSHIIILINKLIQSYGERSIVAAETVVEYKSLSHAIRVYQQAIELLETGKITFPRPNAPLLLAIKRGDCDLPTVKALLVMLDDEVQAQMLTSNVRKRTPALEAAAEEWLLSKLHDLYFTLEQLTQEPTALA
jgi:hypothetical protein